MTPTEAFTMAASTITSCYLCDGPSPTLLAVFVPEQPATYTLMPPVAAGKVQSFWYGLCAGCASLPEPRALVEVKLRCGFLARGN